MLTVEDKKWLIALVKVVVRILVMAIPGGNLEWPDKRAYLYDELIPKDSTQEAYGLIALRQFCRSMGVTLDMRALSHKQAVAQFLKDLRN